MFSKARLCWKNHQNRYTEIKVRGSRDVQVPVGQENLRAYDSEGVNNIHTYVKVWPVPFSFSVFGSSSLQHMIKVLLNCYQFHAVLMCLWLYCLFFFLASQNSNLKNASRLKLLKKKEELMSVSIFQTVKWNCYIAEFGGAYAYFPNKLGRSPWTVGVESFVLHVRYIF